MTRKIKARDVKPGMEIKWTENGWTYQGTPIKIEQRGFPTLSIAFRSARSGWQYVDPDQEVTVLKEAQPDEPTAFGSAVEVAGVKYVRIAPRDLLHSDAQPWLSDVGIRRSWGEICDNGPVTIINADPFDLPAQGATEPRKWDRWEDVPDMVAVRSTTGNVHRKAPDRTELQALDGEWWPSILVTSKLCSLAPFTEVI